MANGNLTPEELARVDEAVANATKSFQKAQQNYNPYFGPGGAAPSFSGLASSISSFSSSISSTFGSAPGGSGAGAGGGAGGGGGGGGGGAG